MALIRGPSHSMIKAIATYTLPSNTWDTSDPGWLCGDCTPSRGRGESSAPQTQALLTHQARQQGLDPLHVLGQTQNLRLELHKHGVICTKLAGLPEQMLGFTMQAPLGLLIKCYYLVTQEHTACAGFSFVNAKSKITSLL